VDVIVNAAECRHGFDNKTIIKNNIGVATNIYDVIKDGGYQSVLKKVVLVSSHSVYGEGTYYCPKCSKKVYTDRKPFETKMECPLCKTKANVHVTGEYKRANPSSMYGIAALAREQITMRLQSELSLPVVVLRVWNTYGSRQYIFDGVVGSLVWQFLEDGIAQINEDGIQVRDFIHVTDVAKAVVLSIMREDMTGIFNVGTSNRSTVLNVAGIIKRKMFKNQKVNIEVTNSFRDGDVRHIASDVRKIRKYGFTSKVGFEGGFNEYISWLKRIGMVDK